MVDYTLLIHRLKADHKRLHDMYVEIATTWPAESPLRATTLEILQSTMENIELLLKQMEH